MNNIDQLRQLMTLDANINTTGIEHNFEQIAKMLFERFAIQKGEKKYLFKDIEFYFYNKNHRDIITHPRVSKPLCWYVNDFGGIDLNFESKIKFENRLNSKGKNVFLALMRIERLLLLKKPTALTILLCLNGKSFLFSS